MKKYIAMLLAVLMVMAMFAGCAKKDPAPETTAAKEPGTTAAEGESTPDETETVGEPDKVVFASRARNGVPPMSEQWLWHEFEKMFNLDIEWIEVPDSALVERKQMMLLNPDDMPDVFYNFWWNQDELASYGEAGTLIDLNDYPDAWPKLKKYLTENVPTGLVQASSANGGIYGFPYIIKAEDVYTRGMKFLINRHFMKALNMEVPTTVEELEAFLKGVKENDVNGNGDPNDEIGFASPDNAGWGLELLEQELSGAYGLCLNGVSMYNQQITIDNDTDVKFLYTHPNLRELWRLMARWIQEGYVYDAMVTNAYPHEKYLTDAKDGKIGLLQANAPDQAYFDAYLDYANIINMTTDFSDPKVGMFNSSVAAPVAGVGYATITNKCTCPEKIISLLDFPYDAEGDFFTRRGVEGVTLVKNDDGELVYTDEILNYENGWSLGAAQYGLMDFQGFPHFERSVYDNLMFLGDEERAEFFKLFIEGVKPFMQDESKIYPTFGATVDEANEMSTLATDIMTYVKETRLKFWTGELSLDTDWDAYVKALEDMGVDRLTEIRQAQFDRFIERTK